MVGDASRHEKSAFLAAARVAEKSVHQVLYGVLFSGPSHEESCEPCGRYNVPEDDRDGLLPTLVMVLAVEALMFCCARNLMYAEHSIKALAAAAGRAWRESVQHHTTANGSHVSNDDAAEDEVQEVTQY